MQADVNVERKPEGELTPEETKNPELSPEEQLKELESEAGARQQEIARLTELVEGTKAGLNEAREKLGLPPTEEDPPSVFSEKDKLEKFQAEQEMLEKRKEELISQQEKEKIISTAKVEDFETKEGSEAVDEKIETKISSIERTSEDVSRILKEIERETTSLDSKEAEFLKRALEGKTEKVTTILDKSISLLKANETLAKKLIGEGADHKKVALSKRIGKVLGGGLGAAPGALIGNPILSAIGASFGSRIGENIALKIHAYKERMNRERKIEEKNELLAEKKEIIKEKTTRFKENLQSLELASAPADVIERMQEKGAETHIQELEQITKESESAFEEFEAKYPHLAVVLEAGVHFGMDTALHGLHLVGDALMVFIGIAGGAGIAEKVSKNLIQFAHSAKDKISKMVEKFGKEKPQSVPELSTA